MALSTRIQVIRITAAGLATQVGASGLKAGELYHVTDLASGTLAIGLSTTTYKTIGRVVTLSEYMTDTQGDYLLSSQILWDSVAVVALTDAATITVDLDGGIFFGGTSEAPLGLGGNRTLGAPSNGNSGQCGILYFTAVTSTRTLTLNAAWLLGTGMEAGPYSIAVGEIFGIAYAKQAANVRVTGILRWAA